MGSQMPTGAQVEEGLEGQEIHMIHYSVAWPSLAPSLLDSLDSKLQG